MKMYKYLALFCYIHLLIFAVLLQIKLLIFVFVSISDSAATSWIYISTGQADEVSLLSSQPAHLSTAGMRDSAGKLIFSPKIYITWGY